MRTRKEVVHAFSPVAKLSPAQKQRMLRVEVMLKEVAEEIIELVPDCPDRTSAIRKVLEAKFNCVQAITHNKSPEEALIPEKKET